MQTLRCCQATDTHRDQHQGEGDRFHHEQHNMRVFYLHPNKYSYHHHQSVRQQHPYYCSEFSEYDPTIQDNHPNDDMLKG